MNYEKYENKIKELLANENIKYNEEELEKVVKYIVEKYDGKTILDENTIDFVLREIRTHMKNRSLRNLVEERANTSPQNKSALKIIDKKYSDYLLKNQHLF